MSGIRGIINEDLDSTYAEKVALKFGNYIKGGSIALASDTRTSSTVIKSGVLSGLIQSGCTVFDLGFSSTPSVFKEVAVRNLDGGIIVTASHNPPQWNGIKFVTKGGRGVFEDELSAIEKTETRVTRPGKVFKRKALYTAILRAKAGANSSPGVKVALDLAGGVGSLFITSILHYQGCVVHSIHDTPGIFPRIIDPTVDNLSTLSNVIKEDECDVGFAYDCDADRLVIVDRRGEKMSGDATLLTCLLYFLENSRNRSVAVSVDTSLAAEDLVREFNGKIVYSKVGESNVVRQILENNCGAGGEGSSGGYIEPSFVMCRDGVHASTMITRMIASEGSLQAITSNFKKYFQDRAKLEIDLKLAPRILEVLAKSSGEVDLTDGVKIRVGDKSWVLVRSSNTENVIRVSVESKSEKRSKELVQEYSSKILEIERELSRNI